ncbi:MAG TPA: hypothetical protein VLE89_01520 [Chlamydiales bacterium]|nr:hypothetical protein [Chlamydiales bacterium]
MSAPVGLSPSQKRKWKEIQSPKIKPPPFVLDPVARKAEVRAVEIFQMWRKMYPRGTQKEFKKFLQEKLVALVEVQGGGVDAEALAGGGGAVVKDVAQVGAALAAENLGPSGKKRKIDLRASAVGNGASKARPTAS